MGTVASHRMRAVLAAGCAAAILTPSVAQARHRTCELIRDEFGDTGWVVSDPVTHEHDDELDIVSADLGIDAVRAVAVIRLARLSEPDPARRDGREYTFEFTVNEVTFEFRADLLTGGGSFSLDRMSGPPGDGARSGQIIGHATGQIDVARREVRMSAPVSAFAPYASMSRGSAVYGLTVRTMHTTGVALPDPVGGPLGVGATGVGGQDGAGGNDSSTRIGAPSCALRDSA